MPNKYVVIAEAPLLRPGLVVETEVSEKYLVVTMQELVRKIREFNETPEGGFDPISKKKKDGSDDKK